MEQILVVDDEEILRKMIRETLELKGYKVMEAGNGMEALENYQKHPADLIIIDIIMPEKEGIETIVEFRRTYPDIKIIAMSGAGFNNPYLTIAKHLGADRILDKPFSSEELTHTVEKLLVN